MNISSPYRRSSFLLGAAVLATWLAFSLSRLQAQTGGKSGAEKAGAAAKPSTAAKTGEKAAAKTKTEVTPPAATKEPAKARPEATSPSDARPATPKPVTDPAQGSLPKAAPVAEPKVTAATPPLSKRRQGLMAGITIFVLAIFVGFELINRVPATLHTPLMSWSNALSGMIVVGALIAAGRGFDFASFLGFFAVALAMISVAGGFLVTHRMLLMFKRG